MKKKFFLGMAVLLGASLFFFGCPADPDDDDSTPVGPEQSLVNDLGGNGTIGDGVVTLKADQEITGSVTIPADLTLKVPTDTVLTVKQSGTLAVKGGLTGEPGGNSADAAQIVVQGTVTVTGTKNFYSEAGVVLDSVAAGVYDWDASFGEAVGGWKQTKLDVADSYALKENEDGTKDDDPVGYGITIVSALKDTATEEVTITLAGKFDPKYITAVGSSNSVKTGKNWDDRKVGEGAVWGAPANGAAEGVYGGVNIEGFFNEALSNVSIHIKPYPALVYYGATVDSPTALTGPVKWNEEAPLYSNLVIAKDETAREKWKLYQSFADGDNFAVLLYSEAAQKIVTLDIEQTTQGEGQTVTFTPIVKVTIDYEAVTFPTDPEVAEPADAT
jgi:hypothetical protein